MSDLIAHPNTVTFKVTKVPNREAQRKTIRRLMRMQPEIQRGLKSLQHRRRVKDNETYIRAGVRWTNRVKATRLTYLEPGAEFTLRISPQIVADIKSVEPFLEARAAS